MNPTDSSRDFDPDNVDTASGAAKVEVGCGCESTGSLGGAWALLALAIAARRRRE